MVHKSHLNELPYRQIRDGKKTIELRINDPKRRQFQVGDIIEFENRTTGEVLSTEIIQLHCYPTFFELFQNIDVLKAGYERQEDAHPEDLEQYYSKEEEKEFGVVGIELKVL